MAPQRPNPKSRPARAVFGLIAPLNRPNFAHFHASPLPPFALFHYLTPLSGAVALLTVQALYTAMRLHPPFALPLCHSERSEESPDDRLALLSLAVQVKRCQLPTHEILRSGACALLTAQTPCVSMPPVPASSFRHGPHFCPRGLRPSNRSNSLRLHASSARQQPYSFLHCHSEQREESPDDRLALSAPQSSRKRSRLPLTREVAGAACRRERCPGLPPSYPL